MNIEKQIKEALNNYAIKSGMSRLKIREHIEWNCIDWLTHQASIISQQSAEIERQRIALEWYADAGHYESKPSDDPFEEWEVPDIFEDRGNRARQALEGESPC